MARQFARDEVGNVYHYDNGKRVVALWPLHRIHDEIMKDWKGPMTSGRIHAAPYIVALRYLATCKDNYGLEGGDMIVAHLLNNAVTWRGDVARRVRAELKAHLEAYNSGLIH